LNKKTTQKNNEWTTSGPLIRILLQDCCFSIHDYAGSEKYKAHIMRMHPFRSVNMFFSQFMQTQSQSFDQPNREWMLLKHTLTAF